MSGRLGRLPPVDGRIGSPGELLRAPPRDGLETGLARALSQAVGARGAAFFASGREALRVALSDLARRSGRDEVVLPAYTCWSVASAAVAARLRVRLVDVDARGWIDPESLSALPLERAACVVVCNLFGIAEPVEPIERLARARGAVVVDDAAQSLGAGSADGAAGGRGALGVVSFGRGKPLQALGGGALLWRDPELAPESHRARRTLRPRAWFRARAWNLALAPVVFRALAATPFLGIGETRFDPGFARGPIGGDALVLCAHAFEQLEVRRARRTAVATALANDLRARTGFEPLLPAPHARGAHPRLALRAPDRVRRDAAVDALAGLGASRLYPAPLDAIPDLRASLAAEPNCPGSRELCDRLLTLPTHGALAGVRWDEALAVLARLAPAAQP